MINRVVLVGRITKDPELRQTQTNIPFVNFTIAINRTYTDQNGETQADFINCIVWRKQAENLAKYVAKGALIGVEGKIQTRQYEVEGQMRYVTEVLCDTIQFLESKGESRSNKQNQFEDNKAVEDEFYETSRELAAEEDLPF